MEGSPGPFATIQIVLSRSWGGCIHAANVTKRKSWSENAIAVNTRVAIIVRHKE